jgi:hypothetical protein
MPTNSVRMRPPIVPVRRRSAARRGSRLTGVSETTAKSGSPKRTMPTGKPRRPTASGAIAPPLAIRPFSTMV